MCKSIVVVGIVTLTSQAVAQTAIPEIVIFANQAPLEAAKVGASVTVVRGDDLRAKGFDNVADALRQVPGVSVTQSGTRGTVTQVRIRGAEANHLLVLIDGIEVNALANGDFDFADLPTDDIERMEVIRGPQSGLYGANAHAGVIAIVTRSGKGLARPAMDARVEGGTQKSASGSINVRGAAGPAYGSMTVTDYTTQGFNISRFGSERDGSRAFTFTAKGGIDVTPNFNIEGVIRHTDRSAKSDPQDFGFGSPTSGLVVDGVNDRTTYQSTASRVGATLKLFDDRWIQSANIKVLNEHLRGFSSGPVFGADGDRVTVDYKSTLLLDTNVFGGEKHSFSFLTDKRREEFQQLAPSQPYEKERIGIAGEYVLDLPTNTTLSNSIRRDFNSAFADVTTWRTAISQRFPGTDTRLHASAGKGLTDPSVFELFGSEFNLPNPKLLPEQSIGWDVGVEQKWLQGRVITDVTYFSSDFTNKIEFTFDPITFQGIYVNAQGTATRRGVEVSNTINWLDWLSTNVTYTYTDAKDSQGLIEIRRPPHSGSFEATAFFAERRGKATIGVSHNSVRKDLSFQTFLPIDLPQTTVVRGILSYDVTPWSTIYVRGENIFNAQYEEILSYRAPGFAAFAGLKVRLN